MERRSGGSAFEPKTILSFGEFGLTEYPSRMWQDEPKARAAFRQGARNAFNSCATHMDPRQLRAVSEWLEELEKWRQGGPARTTLRLVILSAESSRERAWSIAARSDRKRTFASAFNCAMYGASETGNSSREQLCCA